MARRLTLLLLAGALALAVAMPLPATGSGPVAQTAKKCHRKHGKKHCRKRLGPNPYVEGQDCNPAQAKAYARYGFLCLEQPQPDGTLKYQLVKSLA